MADIDIGTKLRTIRAAHGWDQAQLGERAGLWRGGISYVESGTRQLTDRARQTLERALGYGLDDPQIEAAIAVLRNDYSRRELLELLAALASRSNGNG